MLPIKADASMSDFDIWTGIHSINYTQIAFMHLAKNFLLKERLSLQFIDGFDDAITLIDMTLNFQAPLRRLLPL